MRIVPSVSRTALKLVVYLVWGSNVSARRLVLAGHPSDPAVLSRSMGKVPVRWASEIEPAAGRGES